MPTILQKEGPHHPNQVSKFLHLEGNFVLFASLSISILKNLPAYQFDKSKRGASTSRTCSDSIQDLVVDYTISGQINRSIYLDNARNCLRHIIKQYKDNTLSVVPHQLLYVKIC